MSKIVVLGSSDVKWPLLTGEIEDYEKWLEGLATLTLKYFDEVLFIPDAGVYVDFALIFKKLGGKITAVKPFDNTEISKEIINQIDLVMTITGGNGWSYLNTHFIALAPVALCLSYSAGSILEIASSKYSLKYENKKTTILIDSRAVSCELPTELVSELYKVDYFSSNYELKGLYEKIKKDE